ILGMILQFNVFISGQVDVFYRVLITFAFGIFVICLLTLLGTLNVGFTVNDERPGLLALVLFIFAPTIVLTDFSTPLYYLLERGNIELDNGTVGFGFYLAYIGAGLFLLSFIFHVWTFLWKNRLSITIGNQGGSSDEIALVKILRIINSILIIVASVGVIFGMILPAYSSAINPNIAGLLMYEDGSHLDLEALFFMAILFSIVVTAIIVMLSNFGVVKSTRSEIPLLILLGLVFLVPGYVPKENPLGVWTSPFYELLAMMRDVVYNPDLSFTFMGWILIIGIIVSFISVFIAFITFFFSKSAVAAPKGARTSVKKRGKFSAATGPPSALGQEPTVSGQPPTPPSFLASGSPPSAGAAPATDKPTCPFCGKSLRFIDEYQRWYCDSCAQYV
ncbi:MAG: hypothetical protein ACTSPM_06535, partial [Candidatus Heimdallarchaeota archaeon]